MSGTLMAVPATCGWTSYGARETSMKISVLGAGAWGTAMAICLAPRHAVSLWTRDAQFARTIGRSRLNQRYLPSARIPPDVHIGSDLNAALDSSELLVAAVPTAGLRSLLQQVKAARSEVPLIWLCKGFERANARLPHEVFSEELGTAVPCGVLSGPSFADEVARSLPAAVTLASRNPDFARDAARALHGPTLRIYSTNDVVGVEVAGALKNVIAIAAGVCDGLNLGHSARAALITRGLAEITRLGLKMGGRLETYMGLAGAGDLILTCTSDLSRNRRVGLALSQGKPLERILAELGHVAEGVYTAREVHRLAGELGVDMPITNAVCQVLDDPATAPAAVRDLLQREPRPEH
jgi:glycerol-3-phosphate dehydrogenase (NAD(P)+)